jgi:hypothetical protein
MTAEMSKLTMLHRERHTPPAKQKKYGSFICSADAIRQDRSRERWWVCIIQE